MIKRLIAGDVIDGSISLREDTTAENADKSFVIAVLLIELYCLAIKSFNHLMLATRIKSTFHNSLNVFAIHVSMQLCVKSVETPNDELAVSCQNVLFALLGWVK